MKTQLLSISAVALFAAAGYASGSDDGTARHGTSDSSVLALATVQQHNAQDVRFAQMMISHHQQAIEMSQPAAKQAKNPEVKQLAMQIEQAQGRQIKTMTGWLRQWGAQVPDKEMMGGMEQGGVPGMMPEQDMTKLKKATGAEFDRQFLTMMIKHHEGAVTMAREEQAKGSYAPARTLADTIITTQNAQIARMHHLLG